VVSWLTEELVSLGHEITLFASGDSRTSAKLLPACPRALRLRRPRPDPAAAYAGLLDAIAERAEDFDVIHCHIDWVHLPLLQRLPTPFLTTLHGRLDLPDPPSTAERFPNARFVSISVSQRAPLLGLNWLATIHHGLPPDLLKLSERAEGYLAFLGRISPEKGPDIAIRVAHAAACSSALRPRSRAHKIDISTKRSSRSSIRTM
jgi:glycosyltransferase involved in cell wall biosynthesis